MLVWWSASLGCRQMLNETNISFWPESSDPGSFGHSLAVWPWAHHLASGSNLPFPLTQNRHHCDNKPAGLLKKIGDVMKHALRSSECLHLMCVQ